MENNVQAPLLSPKADGFEIKGSKAACLLIHGFTGTPDELRSLGEHLSKQSYHVLAPRLPGHGTSPEDMMLTKKDDWLAECEKNLQKLSRLSMPIFIVGFSMGGLLSLQLAHQFSSLIQGIVVMASPFFFSGFQGRYLAPILRKLPFYPTIKPYYPKVPTDALQPVDHIVYDRMPTQCIFSLYDLMKETRVILPQIQIPTLLIYSQLDPTVSIRNFHYINKKLQNNKKVLLLEKSGHVIPKDIEHETVQKKIVDFIEGELFHV